MPKAIFEGVFCAALAYAINMVNVCGHVGPVNVAK